MISFYLLICLLRFINKVERLFEMIDFDWQRDS